MNKEITRVYGCIPSPIDDRDYTPETVCLSSDRLPESYMLPVKLKILDQLSYGTCVPHAIATAMHYADAMIKKPKKEYSRGYIYANRKDTDFQGEGMIIREALKQLNHYGDCEFIVFPYNNRYQVVKARLEKVRNKCDYNASLNKIINYFKIEKEKDIKTALMTCGAVVCSIPTYDNLDKETTLPSPGQESTGYHAMCLVGWDKTGWIIQNSWGKDFGNNGLTHISYKYPFSEWWGFNVNLTPSNSILKTLYLTTKNIISKVRVCMCKNRG